MALSEYVQECTAAGIWVPESVSCDEGADLPVWRTTATGRQRVTFATAREPLPCDNPALVQQRNPETECLPGARLHVMDSPASGSFCVLVCRKTDLDLPLDQFQDIGLICHKPSSGATCFFNSRVAHLHPSQDKRRFSYAGRNLPGPASKSQTLWMEPMEMERESRCVDCHDADPLIITPNLGRPGDDLRRITATSPHGPYRIVGSRPPFNSQAWQDRRALRDDGPCTECHAIGKGPSGGCGYLFEQAIGDHGRSMGYELDAWMPPTFLDTREAYHRDAERIRRCCQALRSGKSINDGRCQWR